MNEQEQAEAAEPIVEEAAEAVAPPETVTEEAEARTQATNAPPDEAEVRTQEPEAPPETATDEAEVRAQEPETATNEASMRTQALDERERALLRRETRLLALDALVSRGLPPELIDALPLESEERMREALEGVDAAFRRAVEQSVHKRLAGAPPRLGGDGPGAHELALRRALGLNG